MTTVLHKTTKLSLPAKVQDATTLLIEDHKLVDGLFKAYEKALTKTIKKNTGESNMHGTECAYAVGRRNILSGC